MTGIFTTKMKNFINNFSKNQSFGFQNLSIFFDVNKINFMQQNSLK